MNIKINQISIRYWNDKNGTEMKASRAEKKGENIL